MTKFSIRVEPGTFETTASNAVVGRICVELGGKAFPDPDWNDFLSILSHWLETIGRLASGATKSVTLGFMEGPYQVRVSKADNGTLVVTPEDRRGRRVQASSVDALAPSQIINEIRSAADLALKACEKNRIISDDVRNLAVALKRSNDLVCRTS